MSEIRTTETDPIDGEETFIISTHTFKFQLCIPYEYRDFGRLTYNGRVDALRMRVREGLDTLQHVIRQLGDHASEVASSRQGGDDSPLWNLQLKLDGHWDELKQLHFFFTSIRSAYLVDHDNIYGLLESEAGWCNVYWVSLEEDEKNG